jgi:hypothetical protein
MERGYGSALWHRQTKEAETDRLNLTHPRQIPTLPIVTIYNRQSWGYVLFE